jgi:uncharacterized protein (DUF983 family)
MTDLAVTPTLRRALARGWRRRCPRCGQGALFQKWITLHDRCPVCDLQYLENQGDLWGYLLLIDRALFIFPLIVVIYLRVYNPHSLWFYGFVVALIGGLLYTLPHRNGLGVGLEYYRRVRRQTTDAPSPPKLDAPHRDA